MSLNFITQDMIETASLSASNFTPGFNISAGSSNTVSAASGVNTTLLNNTNNLSATELTIIQELQLAANQSIRNFDASFGIILSQSNRSIQQVFRQFNFTLDSGVLRPTVASQQFSWRYQGDIDQAFTVPSNVTYIFAKLWGGGGGAGRAGGWSYGSFGGGGGHTRGVIPVTPGETLTLVLGRGGLNACWYAPYGGGGYPQQNSDIQYAGLGGGYAGIFRGSAGVAANALLIAGGGGGGGSQSGGWGECADGGAGGGLNGFRGECTRDNQYGWGGTGGTQTAAGNSPSIGGITTGSQFAGGRSNSNSYGGGGGGGWWGGGGGSYTGGSIMGGGGGGSGYIHSSIIFGGTYAGFNQMPGFFWDEDLPTQSYNDATRLAYGGISMQNNIGGCSNSGGHSWITIWTP